MNYYPFHIGDYLSATRHLSWEEDAAFRRLLDTYYTTEKPLPADLRAVCRLVLATTDSQRDAVRIVLGEFFTLTDAGWVNNRADAEIAAMREKQQKQRDKANKRWQKPAAEPGNAPAMPRHDETDAAASDFDADAMPPTPTPTPTPTPVKEKPTASSTAKLPTCPYDALVALYQEVLPELPAVRVMDDARKKGIRDRWVWVLTTCKPDGSRRAQTQDEAMDWFRDYFELARDNDFLMGRTTRSGEHKNWKCDIDFLMTTRGLKQVLERTEVA